MTLNQCLYPGYADMNPRLSYYSDKFKRAWYKARVIRSYILSDGESPFIIPKVELVFPAKFMTPMRKTSYMYHDPDESIHVMVKLKQVMMPFIELIQ